MTQPSIRRTAIGAVLTAALTLATPAYAAVWRPPTTTSGWLEAAMQWMTHLWTGKTGPEGGLLKTTGTAASATLDKGHGIDPDGLTLLSQAPPASSGD
ncbi:MAG TPA: hypothetical protein VGH73_06815 [Thermoanaerobaculia bacterium]|jgi:hypothetical protein